MYVTSAVSMADDSTTMKKYQIKPGSVPSAKLPNRLGLGSTLFFQESKKSEN
jgi:hypothetical protein